VIEKKELQKTDKAALAWTQLKLLLEGIDVRTARYYKTLLTSPTVTQYGITIRYELSKNEAAQPAVLPHYGLRMRIPDISTIPC
jgi:hypothetical protein